MNNTAINKMIRQLHMQVRSRVGHCEIGALILSRCSSWKALRVKESTACCIEGYPRCANTFAVVAFTSAQPSRISLAHHSHLAGQVLLAARKNVPILLLIRQPADAIASLMVRDPNTAPAQMLRDYERFHKSLVPIIKKLVVADFIQVTSDYGLVMKRLNKKFNTSFVLFNHSKVNVEKCIKQIEEIDRKIGGRKTVSENHVSRPSIDRNDKLEECKNILKEDGNRKSLNKCQDLYDLFYQEACDI
jgi:hypothetical protein